MEPLLDFARESPLVAAAIIAALGVGGYLLLNRKSAATRDAERRIKELQERDRDRYRQLRPPQ